ncbi:MAG TPA: nucleotide exchange factor GrpE [Rhodothermales bacterium]|nr:nucleotide exchange factor GrpE [Rhodothermales bacterium]
MPNPPDDARQARDEVAQQMQGDTAADVAVAAVDEIAAHAEEAERLRAEVKDLQDQLLRRAAEFQNYRRRTEGELGQAASRGREEVVGMLLDVYDDLRRSIDAASRAAAQEVGAGEGSSGPAFDALRQGVELVYRKFGDALMRLGVEAIEAVGHPFDEHLHEAIMQQPSTGPDAPAGTVLAEIQPGYRMGDRVLRHARVIVAS